MCKLYKNTYRIFMNDILFLVFVGISTGAALIVAALFMQDR